jgi:Secretion system C-terminal sorting domain/Fibronectin type III domain
MKQLFSFMLAVFMMANVTLQANNSHAPCVVCNTAANLKASNIAQTTATVSWSAVGNAQSYDLLVAQALPIPIVPITFTFNGLKTTSQTLTGLTAGVVYTFTVKTNCTDGGTSEYSKLGEFKTLTTTTGSNDCGQVKDFSATVVDSSATIKWVAVTNATSYEITYVSNGKSVTLTSTTNTLTINNLAAGNYVYNIVAVCPNGKSSVFKKGEFTIKKVATTSCGTVTDFGVAVDSSNATIKWGTAVGATAYEVTVYGANGFQKTFSTTSNLVVVTGLAKGTYEYKIKAICPNGTTFSKAGKFEITLKNTPNTSGCGQVLVVKAVQNGIDTTTANASWSAVPNAVSYNVIVTGPNGFTQTFSSLTTNMKITGLPSTGAYTIKVQAVCKAGIGDFSKATEFKITKKTIPTGSNDCGTVKALTVKVIDSTTVTIVWLANLNAKSYEIAITGTNGFTLNLTATASPLTVNKLPVNGSFVVKIKTICANGSSEWSKGVEFKTKGKTTTPTNTTCGTPVGLNVKIYNATTVQLNWSAVKNAVSYEIEVLETTLTGTVSILVKYDAKINTIILDKLTTGSTYKFRVRAICSNGTGEWSKYADFILKGKGFGSDNNGANFGNEDALFQAIYPNPNINGVLNVVMNGKDGNANMAIMNVLGKIIMSVDAAIGATNTYDVSHLDVGTYFVKVTVGEKTQTQRLIIVK